MFTKNEIFSWHKIDVRYVYVKGEESYPTFGKGSKNMCVFVCAFVRYRVFESLCEKRESRLHRHSPSDLGNISYNMWMGLEYFDDNMRIWMQCYLRVIFVVLQGKSHFWEITLLDLFSLWKFGRKIATSYLVFIR